MRLVGLQLPEITVFGNRWCNQLDPNVNRAPFTHWEDAIIIRAWQVCSSVMLATSIGIMICSIDSMQHVRWHCS